MTGVVIGTKKGVEPNEYCVFKVEKEEDGWLRNARAKVTNTTRMSVKAE